MCQTTNRSINCQALIRSESRRYCNQASGETSTGSRSNKQGKGKGFQEEKQYILTLKNPLTLALTAAVYRWTLMIKCLATMSKLLTLPITENTEKRKPQSQAQFENKVRFSWSQNLEIKLLIWYPCVSLTGTRGQGIQLKPSMMGKRWTDPFSYWEDGFPNPQVKITFWHAIIGFSCDRKIRLQPSLALLYHGKTNASNYNKSINITTTVETYLETWLLSVVPSTHDPKVFNN